MRWIFSLIFFWLTFVVSLTGWWLYFGLTTLSQAVDFATQPQLERHQRMLFMEGCVLLVFLISGGLALFYFSYRMYKEKAAKEMFFASFTHDLKTALFRMQLEVEKLGKSNRDVDVENVLAQAKKMHLDLENGLDSTIGENRHIFVEELSFKNFMEEIHVQWPELSIKCSGEGTIHSDRKALHSIFKNLLHNSIAHGKADEISVELVQGKNNSCLTYRDNGQIFKGDINKLGEVYHYKSGGSGFGLYIVKQWMSRLGGKIKFKLGKSQSLEVLIELPGGHG